MTARTEAERRRRRRAKHALYRALATGRLVRPAECELCGCDECGTLHAHHPRGYSVRHRLTVEFLCQRCHNRVHISPAGNAARWGPRRRRRVQEVST